MKLDATLGMGRLATIEGNSGSRPPRCVGYQAWGGRNLRGRDHQEIQLIVDDKNGDGVADSTSGHSAGL